MPCGSRDMAPLLGEPLMITALLACGGFDSRGGFPGGAGALCPRVAFLRSRGVQGIDPVFRAAQEQIPFASGSGCPLIAARSYSVWVAHPARPPARWGGSISVHRLIVPRGLGDLSFGASRPGHPVRVFAAPWQGSCVFPLCSISVCHYGLNFISAPGGSWDSSSSAL